VPSVGIGTEFGIRQVTNGQGHVCEKLIEDARREVGASGDIAELVSEALRADALA